MAKRAGGTRKTTVQGTGRSEALVGHPTEREAQDKELRGAGEHLDESRLEYEFLFEHAPVGYFVVTPQGFVTHVNTIGADLLGRRRDQIIGFAFSLFVAPQSRAAFLSQLKSAADSGGRESCELRLEKTDERELYVQMVMSCTDQRDQPVCRMAATDITALKTAEQQLRESQRSLQEREELFRTVLEQSADAIALTESRRYVEVNPAFQMLVGYTAEELFRMTIFDIVAHDTEDVEADEQRVLKDGLHTLGERNFRRKDGSIVPVETSLSAIRLPNRTIVSHFARDISAKKEGEEELRRLHTAVEQSGEGIIIMDTEGRIQYVNPSFARMTGHRLSDLKGGLWTGLKSLEEDEAFYEKVGTALLQTGMWSGRMKGSKPDGSSFEADVNITAIRDKADQAAGLVAIARDITEEMQAERQMFQLQKMEAIGMAAGGIAHDFNNMLAAVIGNTELALDDVPRDSPVHHNLGQALTAAMRGRDLARKLLTFSRRTERKVSPVHLNTLIDDTYQLLRVTVPTTIEMRATSRADDDTVLADPVEMQQLLMNLCSNASDSIGENGGLLEIAVRNVDVSEGDHFSALGLLPGKHVALTVRDNGAGMTNEVKTHLFEPFFTTKPEGKGTGMGLAVVYGIVKSYQGTVTVESSPGKGATFTIYLPVRLPADGDNGKPD